MIERIASDLGIQKYDSEELARYRCRVIYSSISCWIKTVALDRPIINDDDVSGVSRRHLLERCHLVLDKLIEIFPETSGWFYPDDREDDPVALIRTRLLNHGDLLNSGYETKLALSSYLVMPISASIDVVYGKTLEKGLVYSGISTIRYNENANFHNEYEYVDCWFKTFLNEVWWSSSFPDSERLQYFNPTIKVRNNYSAWQNSIGTIIEGVVLARTELSNNRYNYYLIRPKANLIHKIDPFLQEQQYHRRIMYALRSIADNGIAATIRTYSDHTKIHLNAILPTKENSLLENYAWPVNNISDKLEWEMSNSMWGCIKPNLESLGIQFKEVSNG